MITFLASRRLHRLDGVAGVDRPLERVGRDHLGDFRHLRHVEQRRDARQDVLAGRGRRRDDGVIGRRQRHDQVGQGLGQAMGEGVARGRQHLFHAREFRRGLRRLHHPRRRPGYAPARPERPRRSAPWRSTSLSLPSWTSARRRVSHQSTPASSLSLPTSSATEPTLTPALRLGGSVVFSTFRRGVTSTP